MSEAEKIAKKLSDALHDLLTEGRTATVTKVIDELVRYRVAGHPWHKELQEAREIIRTLTAHIAATAEATLRNPSISREELGEIKQDLAGIMARLERL